MVISKMKVTNNSKNKKPRKMIVTSNSKIRKMKVTSDERSENANGD
jgi:hypothetical protein